MLARFYKSSSAYFLSRKEDRFGLAAQGFKDKTLKKLFREKVSPILFKKLLAKIVLARFYKSSSAYFLSRKEDRFGLAAQGFKDKTLKKLFREKVSPILFKKLLAKIVLARFYKSSSAYFLSRKEDRFGLAAQGFKDKTLKKLFREKVSPILFKKLLAKIVLARFYKSSFAYFLSRKEDRFGLAAQGFKDKTLKKLFREKVSPILFKKLLAKIVLARFYKSSSAYFLSRKEDRFGLPAQGFAFKLNSSFESKQ